MQIAVTQNNYRSLKARYEQHKKHNPEREVFSWTPEGETNPVDLFAQYAFYLLEYMKTQLEKTEANLPSDRWA